MWFVTWTRPTSRRLRNPGREARERRDRRHPGDTVPTYAPERQGFAGPAVVACAIEFLFGLSFREYDDLEYATSGIDDAGEGPYRSTPRIGRSGPSRNRTGRVPGLQP